ncbi:NAD(P)-dependent alcohol dehydrogenase [Thalassotalea ponticola]|uniref:NADPH-dependent aldehyde reductase Ahr n=1 Tax=Thalassotalea ponticola TaxID=1523392 RepID=UPI0025B2A966|nr:NAD(P)-dependent alcohol dehydrogenase [Thalassotalea ponticola]MDN3652691.1 NAD(P)-dependent alcohol dehydrogenase [Thalassotalea ponticola]
MYKAYSCPSVSSALELVEKDSPDLGHHDVEIDVMYCGICHSDVSMIDNAWGMSQYPLVAGHEVVGKISRVGDHVKHLSVGQHVGLGWHSDYCLTCHSCYSGDHNLCQSAEGTIVGRDGGFAEKVVANAASVIAIPDGVDLKSAGPLFCGGITVFNPLVQFGVKPLDKVAVIGIGGLGHMAVQFLNAWGCEVTAFTSSDDKRQEALEFGATHTINSRNPSEIEAAAGTFDYVISTVNVSLDWGLYINTLKAKGRLHFVGAPLEPIEVQVFSLLPQQRSISSSPVGAPATITDMLEFAKQHNIQPLVEMYKFDDINTALDRIRSGKARYRVVLER